MKKLTLDPESLRVQSFPASAGAPVDAGITAADATRPHVCDPLTAWC